MPPSNLTLSHLIVLRHDLIDEWDEGFTSGISSASYSGPYDLTWFTTDSLNVDSSTKLPLLQTQRKLDPEPRQSRFVNYVS